MQKIHDRPVAKAEMLIRRPVADVFEAFVNPAITSKFWFSQGSGRLEVGREVIWEMYDFSVQVNGESRRPQCPNRFGMVRVWRAHADRVDFHGSTG